MARLLYRLGRASAAHPLRTIAAWVAALAVAAGGYLVAGGQLATSFSIPGTDTAEVNDRLAEQIPDLGGLTGTIVVQSEDGSAFTDEQRSAITAVLDDLTGLDRVDGVVDPFATQAQLSEQEQQLADGTAQVEASRAQLDGGQQQLDQGRAGLEANRQQLDAAVAQAQAAGTYDQLAEEFAAQQAQLDAGQAELDQRQAQLDRSRAELEAQSHQLGLAGRLLELAGQLRTVSADGATAAGAVVFADDQFSLPQEARTQVAEALDAASVDGVTIDYAAEIAQTIDGLIGPAEVIGLVAAAIVLLVMLRTLLATVLPLISSLVGVGVGVAGAMAFSGVVDMSSVTPVLGVMLGLAVGIDYALFIINRHRRQLRAGMELHESIGLANGTAGNAVVFAGTTVIVALLALNVTGIGFLGVMGSVGAACVAIAVLVAVSLVPAVLALIGPRVLSARARARIGRPEHAEAPLRAMPTWRAVATIGLAVAGLLVIAIPALSMRLGLPDGSSEAEDSTGYRTYTIVADEFGAGQNGPLLVVAQLPEPVAAEAQLETQVELATRLADLDDVVAVAPVGVNEAGDFLAFQVVPADGPTSESTEDLVHELRALSPLDGEVELGVAGQASGNIDISDLLAAATPVYLVLVVGLSLIIMVVVFRSILVPVIATAGFVLSFLAALGAVVAVYQWGWLGSVLGVHDPGPVLNFAPIVVLGVLFGLAMDYQLFLVSGMREAFVHGAPARLAVTAGLRGGRTVVTAAAIIMTSVFGGFVFSHLTMVRPIGFGLALGVLLDAFVVRMLVVPALMHLVGNAAWWIPAWLDRILPNVDVEGAALEREHPVPGLHPARSEPAGS